MKAPFAALALAVALVTALALQPDRVSAQPANPDLDAVPMTGTIAGLTQTLQGTLDIDRFAMQDGQLVAIGTLDLVLPVTLPVTITQATCEILHLELGPLDLNLLGLVVHLDRVVLDISAQPGPGNLLGNLLCAIAGLLDNPGNGLVAQLNNLLRNL
jgi:hypothetical protein